MKPGPKRKIIVDKTTGCHIPDKKWFSSSGYPQYKHEGRNMQASRVVWIEARGSIPANLQIDHLCRNRKCVNIEHMELVTAAENIRRSPRVKLTIEKVREIRQSTESGVAIAKRLEVSEATICLIRKRETWVDVV